MKRLIGIAPLCVLGTEPADFIRAAAETGYDFVGLRTRPVTATEPDLNLLQQNPRLREVQAVLRDTGMQVYDTEFLAIDSQTQRDIWLPMLEAAQDLAAHSLTVTITDPDLSRATDTLSELVADGRNFGLSITLEPISYQTVQQLRDGIPVARQSGCRLLLDTLHFHRAHCGLEQISEAQPYLADIVQLCDGVLAQRADSREGLIEESRAKRGVPGDGDFPLAECLALLPEDTPVSVEVPNPLFAELGLHGYLRHLKQATEQVLAHSARIRQT